MGQRISPGSDCIIAQSLHCHHLPRPTALSSQSLDLCSLPTNTTVKEKKKKEKGSKISTLISCYSETRVSSCWTFCICQHNYIRLHQLYNLTWSCVRQTASCNLLNHPINLQKKKKAKGHWVFLPAVKVTLRSLGRKQNNSRADLLIHHGLCIIFTKAVTAFSHGPFQQNCNLSLTSSIFHQSWPGPLSVADSVTLIHTE